MSLPRVLIVSTEKGKAHEIAANMGGQKLSEQDALEYYAWNIQNKYYTTQVLLCVTETPGIDIAIEGVEALIVHHDPQAENADQNLEQWSSLISSLTEAEVLLFSCTLITDAAIRDKVVKWCLHKKFEFIELNRSDEALDISEADFEHNKYGIDRIIEALHAHMWPNMILKGKPSTVGEPSSDINEVEEQLENVRLGSDVSERLRMESVLDGIMGGENADFGELFSQLMAMKKHAASLPTNQRRIAAEQLVTAFWKAMGGDPSEIDE